MLWLQLAIEDRRSVTVIDEAAPNGCLGNERFREAERMQRPAEIDIVRRAYELWERTGKPDGRDQEFYHQAERELQKANEQAVPEQPR